MTNDIILEKVSHNTLIPLGIPAHKSTTASNASISFHFTTSGSVPDFIDFEIQIKGKTLFKERMEKTKLSVGKQNWEWDGFDSNGIFSSKTLKENLLELTASANFGANVVSAKQTFEFKHARHSWVDVDIDKNKKLITVELRLNIKDGGENGVGKLPPNKVLNNKQLARLPEASIKHQRLRNFTVLKTLVSQGLQQYWGRAISLNSGEIYKLSTKVTLTPKNAMDDIAVVYNTNDDWIRSSNPGRVRGIYSLFGNMFVRERISYNVGFIGLGFGWSFIPASTADMQFKHTAAHEIGHEILSAYGGESYSYTHRGSSTVLQKTKTIANGGESFPASGEVDLMKYYNGTAMRSLLSRSVASNYDARSLVFLSGMKIK